MNIGHCSALMYVMACKYDCFRSPELRACSLRLGSRTGARALVNRRSGIWQMLAARPSNPTALNPSNPPTIICGKASWITFTMAVAEA